MPHYFGKWRHYKWLTYRIEHPSVEFVANTKMDVSRRNNNKHFLEIAACGAGPGGGLRVGDKWGLAMKFAYFQTNYVTEITDWRNKFSKQFCNGCQPERKTNRWVVDHFADTAYRRTYLPTILCGTAMCMIMLIEIHAPCLWRKFILSVQWHSPLQMYNDIPVFIHYSFFA